MAIVDKNSPLNSVSGQIGNGQLVVRESNGQKILYANSRHKDKPTPEMEIRRKIFAKAHQLAQEAIADPVRKAVYEAKKRPGQTAYNVAVSEISKELSLKPGQREKEKKVGNEMKIVARENAQVASVQFTIKTPDGKEIEKGIAVPAANGQEWIFTLPEQISSENAGKFVISITCSI